MLEKQLSYDVLIVGAGPAGLLAAIDAAAAGARTGVIEANAAAGRKLLLTGAGRCNLSHAGPVRDILQAFGPKGRFLSYSLHEYPSEYIVAFFAERGLSTRVENDGCVFPESQRAPALRDILVQEAKLGGVVFHFGRRVGSVKPRPDGFIVETDSGVFSSRRLVLATGGLSYPQTGSCGDGYGFAQVLGHEIIEPRPSLVPLVTVQQWPADLAGTSIAEVRITAQVKGKKETSCGGLVFTSNGIGGPAVLDFSRFLTDLLPNRQHPISIQVDLVPTMPHDGLAQSLLALCNEHPKKAVAGVLGEFVPKRLARLVASLCACQDVLACHLPKEKRRRIVETLKGLALSISATRPMAEATVTRGGVRVDQVNPKTMESLLCPGLHFAGEILDVDGPCGGYHLQMCWSTGALAGRSAARRKSERA